MNPERWQQIEQLYNAALERKASQRAAFLKEACAGDDELWREVESLLAQDETGKGFLESPAFEVAAQALAQEPAQAQKASLVGRQLGSYHVLSLLGEGGMGEVYRAKDTKLRRDVALKVLPKAFAQDPERLARFEREAQLLASLNHKNIAAIYGKEEAGGVHFLVLELVEGETLAERIERQGPLPVKEALTLCRQVAEGLEAAHRKPITHRDIKPANIKVTPEGEVKVLDFGLAKAFEGEGVNLSELPTLGPGPTRDGQILGTPAYMSPEQVRGQEVDKRTDIWAFGCVLYELLTGQRPFRGDTVQDTIGKVLEREPDWEVLPPATPARIRNLLRRCLQKDPARRFHDLADARIEMEAVLSRRIQRPRTVREGRRRQPGRKPIRALAVLPLANLSGDPEQEYFADGMTEALLTDLAQVSALRVISRTSVMQYKGARRPLSEIARELNVDAVVEGSVLRAGDRVRITAQLIEPVPERHLWAKSYERDLRDILALQSEVARAIAGEIHVHLTHAERARLTTVRPVNSDAHEAYLRGIYHFDRLELAKGMEYYQRALEFDPDYAPVYGRLARGYYYFGFFGVLAPSEAFAKLKEAAALALAKDDGLAEAYGYRALAHLYYDWDWKAAEEGFRRALELKPSHAELSHAYAHFLMVTGRENEGVAACRRAVELDPVGVILTACLGWHCLFARQYEEAIEPLLQALRMDPNLFWSHLILGWTYEQKGMFVQAIAEYHEAVSLSGGAVIAQAALGHAYGLSGRRKEAEEVVAQLSERRRQSYVSAYDVATIFVGMGNTEFAFEWLRKAYEERSSFLIHIQWDPRFDSLRSDPRFQDMLHRIGLPP